MLILEDPGPLLAQESPVTVRSAFPTRTVWVGAALCFTSLTTVPLARGAEHHELQNTSTTALGVESAASIGSLAIVYTLAESPATCSWCRTNGFDTTVRHWLRADAPRWPGYVSHGVSLGLIPGVALGVLANGAYHDGQGHRFGEDAWIMANSFAVTSALAQAVKTSVARQRPSFHYGVEGKTEASNLPSEANLSFFSGDTAWAFNLAASGTTLAYLRGYRAAPYLAAGGAVFATSVAVMRINADMHWATDVMTGALVGTGIGIGMPLLLHARSADPSSAQFNLTPNAGAPGLAFSGIW